MTIVHFDQQSCQRVQRYLDSYLDNELLVETNHEVVRHLELRRLHAEVETRLRGYRVACRSRQSNAPAGLSLRMPAHDSRRRIAIRTNWGAWMLAAL